MHVDPSSPPTTPPAGPFEIRTGDPRDPDAAALLREHLEFVAPFAPPQSTHAMDAEALRGPGVTFWTVREGPALVGCGALRELDAHHGEIKSMRTATGHRRRGVAAALLRHLLDEARRRGYRRVSLETGVADAFAPARALYAGAGFRRCGPFGGYREDGYSVFMTIDLDAASPARR